MLYRSEYCENIVTEKRNAQASSYLSFQTYSSFARQEELNYEVYK